MVYPNISINPGNSGGPLLNLRGEVIGMNTAIVSGAQNIGFAIPINLVRSALDSVRRNGKIVAPYLGVRYVMITKDLAERDKLPVEVGALLRGAEDGPAVLRDSPAAKAGLQAEDIVTKVNDVRVDADHSLGALLTRFTVGDNVRLTVLRDGKTLELTVALSERK
jgi:serine protease Do